MVIVWHRKSAKMSPCSIVPVLLLLVSSVSSFCPDGCGCDENTLTVTCIRAKLEVRNTYNIASYKITTSLGLLNC